jgi:hypothetical protein
VRIVRRFRVTLATEWNWLKRSLLRHDVSENAHDSALLRFEGNRIITQLVASLLLHAAMVPNVLM